MSSGLPILHSPRTAPEVVAERLRAEIAQGSPKPGAPLREVDVAARFGVSRVPVREALRRLEAEGLVVIHPNRGAFVRSFTADEVSEVYDLRLMLEVDLLKRSVDRIGAGDLRLIEMLMAQAEIGASSREWRDLDNRFHHALYAPALRPHHARLVGTLRGTIAHYRAADESLAVSPDGWLADHREIVDACRRSDGALAAEILTRHLERAREITLGSMAG